MVFSHQPGRGNERCPHFLWKAACRTERNRRGAHGFQALLIPLISRRISEIAPPFLQDRHGRNSVGTKKRAKCIAWKACGVTGNAISNWERDVARPDASLVPTLCNLLNIPLYDFFGMENPNPYSSDEKALVADYRYMTDPNKRQLRSIVSAIIDSQDETRRENYRKNFCHLVGHDAGLAAGFGGPLDEEPEAYPVFVRISREACRSDDVFPVNGQSMEPDYPDGSMVFVERVDASDLEYGDIIACIVAGTPYVKIYEKDGLHSINPKYSVIGVTEDDNMRLIGRVVGLVDPDDMASEAETKELMEVFADELD